MRSMTGFGQAATETDSCRVDVRLRSVNHRFLDVALRLPEEFRDREPLVREAIQSRLHRGRVEARIEIEDLRERDLTASVNTTLLAALTGVRKQLEHAGLPLAPLQLGDLLRIPNAVRISAAHAEGDSAVDRQIEATLLGALEQLQQERAAEGEKLSTILAEKLDALDNSLQAISERSKLVRQVLADGFRRRIAELMDDPSRLDEHRLAQEIAFLAERADIQEELDRLATHLGHLREAMTHDGPVGKRLGFLAQEVLRELNTLASKCRTTEVLNLAIEAKLACEQLREQIQNIE